ncbi:toxin YhaV [Halomonas ventosae]|uniref:Toxin YhaV n=1 Tax=Halomonas ventosae TaxID=229007 RepID=A0A4R6GSQ2_9GAMM|nr:toxin YhaV [Halomonas ventosae]
MKLALSDIPQAPSVAQYRQGNTLGTEHIHWRWATFYQQYRLFFRYDFASKILIYAWVNDDSTRRTYENKHDAYAVFRKMLKNGNPPDSENDLCNAALGDGERIKALLGAECEDDP